MQGWRDLGVDKAMGIQRPKLAAFEGIRAYGEAQGTLPDFGSFIKAVEEACDKKLELQLHTGQVGRRNLLALLPILSY